ncbi:hypothetical protein EOT10_05680 [Streptomyces antnestii]|uniref:Uncharacterized protein n=1 Tax=Streptomyces antnestii TaxID=2494256 RepID=A0A3S2W4K9_9ACTN|nr:hypothetical protein [Streptomyces sp. San01]RVU27782.1 hypothetical protein EOT10_05680 [Streptomyces sp. San01]
MEPVLEVFDATGFRAWPVADLPAGHLLPLSGDLSMPETGTAVATLAEYASRPTGDGVLAADPAACLRGLTDAELLLPPGGLRVRDPGTGAEIRPGCCCGVEDWREWWVLVDGGEPWLGHDAARIEFAGADVRLWPVVGVAQAAPRLPVEIPLAELPAMLRATQELLVGFLDRVEQWALSYAPEPAARTRDKVDRDLGITASGR